MKRFSPDRSPCCKSTWAPFSLSSGPSLCTQQTRNGGRPKPLPFPSRIFSGPAAERVAAAFPPQRRPPRQLSINQDPGDKSLLTRHLQLFSHTCSGPGSPPGANEGSRLGKERPCEFWPVRPPWSFTVHLTRLRNQGQGTGASSDTGFRWGGRFQILLS